MATPNHGISPIMFVPQEHLGVRHGWGRQMANCFDHIAGSCVLVEENEFVIPVAIDVMHGDHARMCHIACSTFFSFHRWSASEFSWSVGNLPRVVW